MAVILWQKTGVLLPYIVNETGAEFLKRFEASIGSQLEMRERLLMHLLLKIIIKALTL